MTRVIEPAPQTGAARTGADAMTGSGSQSPPDAPAAPERAASEALAELVATLDRACDELFATVPFLGDQATGASVNACVDELVGALRDLRADADDLRRVMTISEQPVSESS